MSHLSLTVLLPLVTSHIAPVAMILARLTPVAFWCPFLGGSAVPSFVRLALLLSLAWALHVLGHLELPSTVPATMLAGMVVREVIFGVAVGMTASLPFEAARMGGRFMDQFRGASGEVALPGIGTHESAASHGLYQLLLALSTQGVAMPLVLHGVFRSFGQVHLGAAAPNGSMVFQVVSLAGLAMGSGLAVGAPVAGVGLALDMAVGLATRALPRLSWSELSVPVRLLAGAAVLWLGVKVISTQLLTGFDQVPAQLVQMATPP